MLAPIVQTLTDVSTAMCGGAREFVWTLDKRRHTQHTLAVLAQQVQNYVHFLLASPGRIVLMAPTAGGGWDNLPESIQLLASI